MGLTAKLLKGTLYAGGLRIGKLDGYERLIAGIYGRPDRVPIILQPYTFAMAQHGLPARRFFTEPEPFVNASRNTAAYFGADSWSPIFDFYNIELEALGQKLIWRENSEPDVDTRGTTSGVSSRRFRAGAGACLTSWNRIGATST